MDSIGENIRRIREEHKFTQKDLAAIMGISPKYLSALERNERKPGHKIMAGLCEALGVSEEDIRNYKLSPDLKLVWDDIQNLSTDKLLSLRLWLREQGLVP